MHDFLNDSKFEGLKPLEIRAFFSSDTPHKVDEMKYIEECYEKDALSTFGSNIDAVEKILSYYFIPFICCIGCWHILNDLDFADYFGSIK